jgi:hypothetical protein
VVEEHRVVAESFGEGSGDLAMDGLAGNRDPWLSIAPSNLAAERLSVYARAGYASLREYAERVLGLKPRQTEERLRVGRALAQLPLLDAALAAARAAVDARRSFRARFRGRRWIDIADRRRAQRRSGVPAAPR